jgi:hypothetical protein
MEKHIYYVETWTPKGEESFTFKFQPTMALLRFLKKLSKTGRQVIYLQDTSKGKVILDKRRMLRD